MAQPLRFSVPRYSPSQAERETVAAVIILEAGGEGLGGMEAIMSVINNRAKDQPALYEMVVTKPSQFSSLNSSIGNPKRFAKMLAHAKRHPAWHAALSIVDRAAKGNLVDRTGGATYFLESSARPHWLPGVRLTAVIGDHRFFIPRNS